MQVPVLLLLVVGIAMCAYPNYYILESHPKYVLCPDQTYNNISVPHSTLCSIRCLHRHCKFFYFKDGVCHMLGDSSELDAHEHSLWYRPRENNLTNVAASKSASGSTPHSISGVDSDGNSWTATYSPYLGVDCSTSRYESKQVLDPWWSVNMYTEYRVHSINILLDSSHLNEFIDVIVYIGDQSQAPSGGDFTALTQLTKYEGPYTQVQWLNYTLDPPMMIQYVGIKRFLSNGRLVFGEMEAQGELEDMIP